MFVKKISKLYQEYNPNGPTRYAIMYNDDEMPYIQEVGKFNKEDMQLDNTILHCSYKNCAGQYEDFTVFRKIYDLFMTPEDCEKHYNKTHGIRVIESIKDVVKYLREDGFKVIKQKNCNVYQINKIGGLQGITFSETIADFRIGFWENDNSIQTFVNNPQVLFDFIKSLTC